MGIRGEARIIKRGDRDVHREEKGESGDLREGRTFSRIEKEGSEKKFQAPGMFFLLAYLLTPK